jgi:hypothetical protein
MKSGEIEFKVDSTIALGWYSDSIVMHTETGLNPFFMGGDEILPFGARVICRPPFWKINPADYALTMNMNLRLNFGGVFSTDPRIKWVYILLDSCAVLLS